MPFLGTRGAGSNRAFGYAGAAKPNQVTGLTATDFGTSRAFNDGRIDLSWTAPANNGATISGYLIERSTDNSTYSTLVASTGTSATTYSDTSLTSSQIYYYKVSAINAAGTGDASTAASATATTVPQAPTIGTAADGGTGTTVTVTYTAGATGGKAVSAYTATSSPGSLTGTGASPITVSGLSAGTAYTFTVTATNANGTSTASAASNSITPELPSSFDSIATLSGSGATTVTFSSIPQGYKALQIRVFGKSGGTNNDELNIRFNGITTSTYRDHYLRTQSTNPSAGTDATTSFYNVLRFTGTGNAPGVFSAAIIDVIDYASTSKLKTLKSFDGYDTAGGTAGYRTGLYSGLFNSTTAITSITLLSGTPTNFAAGTTFALYGIK